MQENIAAGQRIEKALLEYWDGKEWKNLAEFTTVGYKRLLRFNVHTLQKLRVTILESRELFSFQRLVFLKHQQRNNRLTN